MLLVVFVGFSLSACASSPVQQNPQPAVQSEVEREKPAEPDEENASLDDLRGSLLPKYETMKRP